MVNIAGKKVPNVLIYVLAGALVLLAVWALWPSGGDDQKMYEVPGKGLLTADQYNDYLKGQPAQTSVSEAKANLTAPAVPTAPVLPVTVSEVPVVQSITENELVAEPEPESETEDGKGITLKLSKFEDWVNGELSVKDSDITEISVFGSKKAAQDFAEEYNWNDKHDFAWNFDEFALFVANEYGESDPAPAVFFSTTTAYFVVLSGDGVTADFYELDTKKDEKGELVEKKGGEKSVYAVDQLETDAS